MGHGSNRRERIEQFWKSHHKGLEGAWIVGVVAYSGFLTFVVSKTVSKYHVSTRWFGVVALLAAIPDAGGTAKLVSALVDHDMAKARQWGFVAATGYFAPEAFILLTGRHLPIRVYVVLGVWVSIAFALMVLSMRKKIRVAHLHRHSATRSAPVSPAPNDTNGEP
ncbi:MAG: hypothetical protein WBD02_05145 [Acidimicrobiia bacterium]